MTKTNLFILFTIMYAINVTTAVKEGAVVEGMFDKLREDVFESKECYGKIIDSYIDEMGLDSSQIAGLDIKQICPTVVHSCCTNTNFVKIHKNIKENFTKATNFISIVTSLIDKISQISEDKLFALKENMTKKECIDSTSNEIDPFSLNVNYFTENKEKIKESLETGMEYAIRAGAGFGCTLCDQESHAALITKRKQKPVLQFDVKQCKIFYNDPQSHHFIRTFVEFRKLFDLWKVVSCMNSNYTVKEFDLLAEDNFDIAVKSITECGEGNNFLKEKVCVEICKELSLVNQNPFAKYTESIVLMNLIADYIFKEEADALPEKSELQKVFVEKIDKSLNRFYLTPISGKKANLEQFEIKYEFGTGFNTVAHNFILNDVELFEDENNNNIKKIIVKGAINMKSQSVISIFVFTAVMLLFRA